jgi:hypothetical protein
MFTAIVLDAESQEKLKRFAAIILPKGVNLICHHVTLCLGTSTDYTLGETREITATHFGELVGRVLAFKVDGAYDSRNITPHVTAAVLGAAKPKESNEIKKWFRLPEEIKLSGIVQICN